MLPFEIGSSGDISRLEPCHPAMIKQNNVYRTLQAAINIEIRIQLTEERTGLGPSPGKLCVSFFSSDAHSEKMSE
jgi:hypothetical protein